MLIMYLRSGVSEVLLKALFNVDTINHISFPLLEDNIFGSINTNDYLKQSIFNILEYIRSTKALFQNLLFVIEGTDSERM